MHENALRIRFRDGAPVETYDALINALDGLLDFLRQGHPVPLSVPVQNAFADLYNDAIAKQRAFVSTIRVEVGLTSSARAAVVGGSTSAQA